MKLCGEKELLTNPLLKIISFLTLPIFLMLIAIDVIVIAYSIDNPEVRESTNFYDTDMFISSYMDEVTRICTNVNDEIENNFVYDEYGYIIEEDGENINNSTPVYVQDGEYRIYYQSNHIKKKFIYLVVDSEKKIAYTNIQQTEQTNSINELKQDLISENKYWSIADNNIQTNIERLSKENIVYNQDLQELQTFSENKEYYTAYDETVKNWDSSNDIGITSAVYYQMQELYGFSYTTLIVSMIIGIIELIYLIYSVGHSKEKEGISLTWIDKIPLEILTVIYFIMLFIETMLMASCVVILTVDVNLSLMLIVMSGYFTALNALYIAGTLLKRIKSNTIIANTICYRFLKWVGRKLSNLKNAIFTNLKISRKVGIYFAGIVIVSALLIGIFRDFGILLDIVFWIWCYYKIMKEVNKFKEIHDATEKIYKGDTNIKIDEHLYTGLLKELAMYINDIAGGFTNAVNESIKSERMKTELITNVSHDIKTPLTSIINYVDLLKQEDIKDEKAKEYIEVLDNKSQRLKKLIEDLVEASKASSGNIKITKEVLNVNELLNQITGEFEDKFEKRGLRIISKLPEEKVFIKADSRYLYRVLENVYSNVAKYAEENSRVYVDCVIENDDIAIYVKNISKDELNISADELMQRFVRGDKSRNTEGSGLGLSIAKSLTELQDGTFNIHLDGDLFKVAIKFKKV